MFEFAPPSMASSDGARSAVPVSGDSGGSVVGAVVGTVLVLIVLAFAVIALVVALRRNNSSGCSTPPPTPWVQELAQDVAANDSAIQNLEQEVGGGSSPDAPPRPASLTVRPSEGRAPQSMLLDRTPVGFYDGTRELQEQVRGAAAGAPDQHGGFSSVGASGMISDVQKNEHLPLGEHEMGVQEQFAPAQKSATMEDIDGSVIPYDGKDDDAMASFDQFKDARLEPYFVTGDGMPLPTRSGMTKYRAPPASAFDFTDGAVDDALSQFIASEAHEVNGELNGGKNLLWAELAGLSA